MVYKLMELKHNVLSVPFVVEQRLAHCFCESSDSKYPQAL